MAANRAQADLLFTYALNRVRGHRVTGGGTTLDPRQLADTMAARRAPGSTVTRTDINAAIRRAIRANDLGARMTANPLNDDAPIRREYPNKPVLDRRRGDYEYRVVVRAQFGADVAENLIVFQSRSRLSGEQVFARAGQVWAALAPLQQSLRAGSAPIPATVAPNYFIVSATFFDPIRYGESGR